MCRAFPTFCLGLLSPGHSLTHFVPFSLTHPITPLLFYLYFMQELKGKWGGLGKGAFAWSNEVCMYSKHYQCNQRVITVYDDPLLYVILHVVSGDWNDTT